MTKAPPQPIGIGEEVTTPVTVPLKPHSPEYGAGGGIKLATSAQSIGGKLVGQEITGSGAVTGAMAIYKNGSIAHTIGEFPDSVWSASGAKISIQGSALLDLAASDTVDIYAIRGSGTTVQVNDGYFQGFLLV